MAKKRQRGGRAKTLEPAEAQNRLLVVLLLKLGASTNEVAIALGVSRRRVQQMIPVNKIAKLNLGQINTES
jgi:DNA invertase Pin-like site-specific DNA recombinase